MFRYLMKLLINNFYANILKKINNYNIYFFIEIKLY